MDGWIASLFTHTGILHTLVDHGPHAEDVDHDPAQQQARAVVPRADNVRAPLPVPGCVKGPAALRPVADQHAVQDEGVEPRRHAVAQHAAARGQEGLAAVAEGRHELRGPQQPPQDAVGAPQPAGPELAGQVDDVDDEQVVVVVGVVVVVVVVAVITTTVWALSLLLLLLWLRVLDDKGDDVCYCLGAEEGLRGHGERVQVVVKRCPCVVQVGHIVRAEALVLELPLSKVKDG